MPSAYEQLVTVRDGYLQALANDALNPVPTHTIDNISVSATEWRQAMLENIARINKLLNAFNPQEKRSIIM